VRTRVTAAALGALVMLTLAGCTTPEPTDPTPTPTSAFASEEEAFAAAEATYRAYVDAVNARREDPTAVPAPTDFLIADALEAEISAENIKTSEGLSISGSTVVTGVEGVTWEPQRDEVELTVCVDSSGTTVHDVTGTDVTPKDRPEIYALRVHFEVMSDAMVIVSTQQDASATC
jgi:hypothetical protein